MPLRSKPPFSSVLTVEKARESCLCEALHVDGSGESDEKMFLGVGTHEFGFAFSDARDRLVDV